MNNLSDRLHEVFFYGLYMDEEILKNKGVEPRNRKVGVAQGYKLRIGNMATLLRVKNSEAYGLVYSLTQEEIEKLYAGSGLTAYIAESILIKTDENEMIATLCCNLINPPSPDEKNSDYYQKLIICMEKYKLPRPKNV